VGNIICERLAEGESLRTICKDDGLPEARTVHRWLEANEVFRQQYARARELQADFYAEQIVEIADEEVITVKRKNGAVGDETVGMEVVFDPTAVARNRLRVDARKWYASKLQPKKYGDRTTLAGDAESPLSIVLDQIAADPRNRIAVK
jgi:hypothetical protein